MTQNVTILGRVDIHHNYRRIHYRLLNRLLKNEKLSLGHRMSYHLLSIQKLGNQTAISFPCYFVASTAPINVEDRIIFQDSDPSPYIAEITQYLKAHGSDAEILILIHGYNTGRSGVEQWYKTACEYISRQYPQRPKGLVVLGYRWSSEQFSGDESGTWQNKIQFAQKSLPRFVSGLSQFALLGIAGSLLGLLVSLWKVISDGLSATTSMLSIWLILLVASVFVLLGSLTIGLPVFTLLLLRLSGYFRDAFRANNYGVADLVELIRQLDDGLVETQSHSDRADREQAWDSARIRLSFIGHSMGGFVVTDAVRILSDVFDKASIGSLDLLKRAKAPSQKIGNVFSLGRLVLVAPDIPSETLVAGRANVLRSSLRRFEEAYLFCNEGDMALRLASTAANYFSYPAKTQEGGYRLGNVAVREVGQMRQAKLEQAGVVNLYADGCLAPIDAQHPFLDYLFLRSSTTLTQRQSDVFLLQSAEVPDTTEPRSIAELFTFFDCTNYREQVPNPKTGRKEWKGIVSRALGKSNLSLWDYCLLTLDFGRGKVDPHGGYIFCPEAEFSKRSIYGLACLGWRGFLQALKTDPQYSTQFTEQFQQIQKMQPKLTPDQQERLAALQLLNEVCKVRGIQVLLSPERYQVDVLDQPYDRSDY